MPARYYPSSCVRPPSVSPSLCPSVTSRYCIKTAERNYAINAPHRPGTLVLVRFAVGFLFNPHFDLEPDYIIRKPLLRSIQRYILRREILSTFHTRVDNRSIGHFCILFTPKLPLPLRRSPKKSNTPMLSTTPLITPNDIRIHSCLLYTSDAADE